MGEQTKTKETDGKIKKEAGKAGEKKAEAKEAEKTGDEKTEAKEAEKTGEEGEEGEEIIRDWWDVDLEIPDTSVRTAEWWDDALWFENGQAETDTAEAPAAKKLKTAVTNGATS